MVVRIARLAIAAPGRIMALAALIMVATALFGGSVFSHLSAGGMHDPGSDSAQAARLLADKFDRGDMQMLVTVTSAAGTAAPAARAAGLDVVERLSRSPHVTYVMSPWTTPPGASATLVSRDGRTGLVVAGISGGESGAQRHARQLAERVVGDYDGVTVRAGGEATIYWQVNDQTRRDLLRMEALAMPLCFLVTVWVFGGLLAAALPMIIGGFAILGALAALHAISLVTEVSVFALNLTLAMGLGLGIDYTLLILSRLRDELAEGVSRDEALLRTMATAGRTVVFSAMTVALSVATMALFPQYFLKSFAYAGVAVVVFAALAAVVVTPAAVTLLGGWLDYLDVRHLVRRWIKRTEPQPKRVDQTFFYRSTRWVMRHAVPAGAAVLVLLGILGSPFLQVRRGFPDDRVLPASASARQVGELLRNDFAVDPSTDVTVVIPDAAGVGVGELDSYAAALSKVPEVASVSAPNGTFVAGKSTGPPSAPAGIASDSAFLTVTSDAPLFSRASGGQLAALHAVPTPGGKIVQLAGIVPSNQHDSVHAITSRLPLVLGVIGVVTLVLLFALTGSAVIPVKSVLLNVVSLSAAFGALVWVFQQGHLGGLGTAVTGTLEVNLPVLLFCVAFGLSMDYEVFVISRIHEYWLGTAANDDSVALGVAGTGRVVTAAALIMAISFAALMGAQVSFMRLFGLGLTLAVLVDATLVRLVLLPAVMHLLGKFNWWSPKALARLRIWSGSRPAPIVAMPVRPNPGSE